MTATLDTTILLEHLPPQVETEFTGEGILIRIPADFCVEDPIVIRRRGIQPRSHISIKAERGSRATLLERIELVDAPTEAPFRAVLERNVAIHAGENAHISFATLQTLPPESQLHVKRTAQCRRGATVAWSSAELGAGAVTGTIDTAILGENAHADAAIVFFPNASQRVDVVSTIEHHVGHSTSDTLVKSAAIDRGQGKYLGVIRIARDAQGSDARLRDDALLLSKNARIDSVPALEIAANDVKAYHGATVGAIDAEQIFYLESRGIPREQGEKMIALGFFEPAIERFPEQLREEIRNALAAKIT